MTLFPTLVGPSAGATSFEEFHRRQATPALRYARAIMGPDGAEDVCQEAWLRAWLAWGAADPDKVEAWLRTIVRNCCFEAQRRARNAAVPTQGAVDAVVAPDEAAMARLELAALWAGLDHLSPALREALWLREGEELSYAEISLRQRVPVGTVMSRLHSARAQARRLRADVAG
jgi:RNA polymerase sigma-70 factor (ECF subfamily)